MGSGNRYGCPAPRRLAIVHATIVACAVAGAGLAPAAEGTMIVVPLGSTTTAMTANWTMRAGGAIVGIRSGALVIFGRRARLLPAALANRSLLVRAPARFCTATLPKGSI